MHCVKVLTLDIDLQKALVQNEIDGLIFVFVIDDSHRWRSQQLVIQIDEVELFAFEQYKLVLGPLFGGLEVFVLGDNWVEDCLVELVLRISSTLFYLQLNIILDQLHLIFFFEGVDQLREVVHVILVIHFSELFKNNELVDGSVDLLATGILEF